MSNPQQPSSGSGSGQTTTSSGHQNTGGSGGGGRTWPAAKSGEIPRGSSKYVNDNFGEPTGGQERVILEGSAVVSRTDENGNRFEALTDGPVDGDVPIKVLEADFEEKAAERHAWNAPHTSSSGSSSSGSSGSSSSGSSGSSGSGH